MADRKKMVILRGNSDDAGKLYPDKSGKPIKWHIGALHREAAEDYARQRGYIGDVLPIPGQPQNDHSPQTKAAVKMFLDPKESVAAFYGFSGGGYNVLFILTQIARDHPELLDRIELVVVLGSPYKDGHGKSRYVPSRYGTNANWELVYRENPDPDQLPKGLPPHTQTHMFGPDVLLSGWPE